MIVDNIPVGIDPECDGGDRDEPRGRVDLIFETLGDEIVSGSIRPGDRLPEEALARRFGTSRGPLREALRRLEERRLVIRIPNVGARVRRFTSDDFRELYDVRGALEGLAARLAAERGDPASLEALARAFQAHRSVVEAGAEHVRQKDLEFHQCVARASGNAMVVSLLCSDFYSFLAICRRQFPRIPGRDERALTEHRRVLEAIEEGDGELAEILIRRHVMNAKRNYEKALGNDGSCAGGTAAVHE